MTPLVSVIIPVYNGERSINNTIESVLNQTFSNFEIILIDDGSTDDTEKVINQFLQYSSVKYVYQENQGVSTARNNGIRHAIGRYVCFLDSDDFYEQTYLEKMANKIKVNNADYCYSGYNLVINSGKKKVITHFYSNDILLKLIKGNIKTSTNSWMIKKELLLNHDIFFTENVSWGEDVEFFYKVVASTSNGTYVAEYLTNYDKSEQGNRLSNFSLDLIDKDYNFVKRVIDNPLINKNAEIETALIDDRLSALISNKLLTAVKLNYDKNELKRYYEKYRPYIATYTWKNGIRSIKLNVTKLVLNIKFK